MYRGLEELRLLSGVPVVFRLGILRHVVSLDQISMSAWVIL